MIRVAGQKKQYWSQQNCKIKEDDGKKCTLNIENELKELDIVQFW